jgi:hypothetical protein
MFRAAVGPVITAVALWAFAANADSTFPDAPSFDWIADGQHRPVPHTASVILACDFTHPAEACLDAQWRKVLHSLSEVPLSAPAHGRSYRLVWIRSFHRPAAIRIDVDEHGHAVLTTRWARQGHHDHRPIQPRPAPASLTQTEVAAIETALSTHGFSTMIADEQAIPDDKAVICSDGAEWIIEAVMDGRYRYVDGGCRWDQDAIVSMGEPFIDLAKRKTPSPDFEPIY